MSADFDPYYTWLGIPPEEQPPNHYRLLGVKAFETNLDVIANAADRQVMHIRTFQQGKFADQSQAVLNKLSAARVCLLNVESKGAYDRQLRQQLEGAQSAAAAKPAPAPAKAKPLATAKPLPTATALPEKPAPHVNVGQPSQPHPGIQPGAPQMPHGVAPLTPPIRQDLPPWVLPVGIGGVLAVLVVGGLAAFWLMGSSSPKPNPPIVTPGPGPGPLPGPGPRPPFPGPPVPGARNPGIEIQASSPTPIIAPQAGMVGRLSINNQDTGILLRYLRGAGFTNNALTKLSEYPLPGGPRKGEFVGWINVPAPTNVIVRHSGGGTSANSEIQISNQVVNQQNPGSRTTIETPVVLRPGGHQLRWKFEVPEHLSGAIYLRVEVVDAVSRQPLPIFHRREDEGNGANPNFADVTVSDGSLQASPWRGPPAVAENKPDPFQPVDPPMKTNEPPAPLEIAYPPSALDTSLTSTKGLVGRLFVNNEDTGVVVRYRMSGVVSQQNLDLIRNRYNLPAGAIRLRLEGRLQARNNSAFSIRAWGGSPTGSATLSVSNQEAIKLGRDKGTYESKKGRVSGGTGSYVTLAWEIEGDDIGSCALEVKGENDTLVVPSYAPSALRSIGAGAKHEVFVARSPFLPLERPNYSGIVDTNPPDPSNPIVSSIEGSVVKGEEELDDTTGTIGRLLIDNQDVGVVVRYRMGAPMKASWFDDLRRELKLPAGTPKLEMKSRFFPVARGLSVMYTMEGGVRDGSEAELRYGDRRVERTGSSNFRTKADIYDYVQANTVVDLTWVLRGLPQGSASLKIGQQGRDDAQLICGYTTAELQAERKHPLRAEVLYTPKNTIILRWTGGRTTSALAISTDPAATITALPNPGLALAGADAEAAKRHAEPDATARATAAKQVRDIFGKEIDSAKSPAERTALAQKMIQVSRETNDDAAARFMLLITARDTAAAAGDSNGISQAIEELSQGYEVDTIRLRTDAFVAAGKALVPPEGLAPLALAALDAVELAVEADRLDAAMSLVDVAVDVSKRSKDKDLQKNTFDRRKELVAQKKQYDAVDAAQKALLANAEDPAANLAVGKYYAMVKSDWQKGASHLAKGSDATIAAAAKLDVAGASDADARVKLGDAWWDAADKAAEDDRIPLKVRAHHWYKLALSELDGLAKLKIEKRVQEVDADAQRLASRGGGTSGKPGAERPVAGLLLRAADGNPPQQKLTHLLAVISDSTDLDNWVEAKVREELRNVGTNFSAVYTCMGYVNLPQNGSVTFEGKYVAIVLDGKPLMPSNFANRTVTVNLTRGMHPVVFYCTDSYSSEFKAYDATTKSNVLFYLPSQLQTEMQRSVAGPGGQALKTILMKKP